MNSRTRPSVFIASSSEAKDVAATLQSLLEESCECELWDQDVFEPSLSALESLSRALPRFDYAVFMMSADDKISARHRVKRVPRDNVLFELGISIGVLGPERTFMVQDKTNPSALPTDLAGITWVEYQPHQEGITAGSLRPAARCIRKCIEKRGLASSPRVRDLVEYWPFRPNAIQDLKDRILQAKTFFASGLGLNSLATVLNDPEVLPELAGRIKQNQLKMTFVYWDGPLPVREDETGRDRFQRRIREGQSQLFKFAGALGDHLGKPPKDLPIEFRIYRSQVVPRHLLIQADDTVYVGPYSSSQVGQFSWLMKLQSHGEKLYDHFRAEIGYVKENSIKTHSSVPRARASVGISRRNSAPSTGKGRTMKTSRVARLGKSR